ncbi:MAG: hypothetical protein H6810_02825 [Phycisphaeraceae bacterium]|nr:MAG: hypothetical protein H6810_02825 [Phycisphaeraceae bacterium]
MEYAFSEIAGVLRDALVAADESAVAEQAVKGVDALREIDLHAILADGLAKAGWGVHREIPYPADAARGDNDRDRCDLVLTPSPADRLADPVHAGRRVAAAEGTLFAPMADRMEADASRDAVEPGDALWLEIKVVAQHRYRHGVPGPNRSYSSELVDGPASDAAKLECDTIIRHAAAVVVLFTEGEDVARHDLLEMAHRLLDRDLPVGTPIIECGPIHDRAGNACVAVALLPMRGLGLE